MLSAVPSDDAVQFKPTNIQSVRATIRMGVQGLEAEVGVKVALPVRSRDRPAVRTRMERNPIEYRKEFSLF